ncbi:hypothetical protein [Pedobacter sp. SYSU D00535]|uniref:hypothetical protein n=1 Tax=Pedobacter sp. SYSU D00535 TaxID=2810308 RepID=UPI001A95F5A2|nr:hypothetical protein [Pedobacter sp. SYSU D00535]
MKVFRFCVVALCLGMVLTFHNQASAQCAMCSMNAENSVQNGNTQGKGLNDGILYLLAAPYLAVAAVGYLWYKRYRKKNVTIELPEERIHLN